MKDEHEHESGGGTMLGFWLYIMSDCLIFACLFAAFGVMGGNYAGGPTPKDIFELPTVAINTAMLLLSSITYGFAMLAMQRDRVGPTQLWLLVTALFGMAFIGIELHEFAGMIRDGATPQRSAFLSSFFTLVGTHGLHVTCGPDLAIHAGGAGGDARPDPGQQAPADVPVAVLALPRRGMDRRVHLRLSDGDIAMTAGQSASHDAEHDHKHGHDDNTEPHGTLRGYLTGFSCRSSDGGAVLAGNVGRIPQPLYTALTIMVFAAVQVVVHMVFFLHMNHKSEGGWTLMALIFTLVLVVIMLVGSLWVMYHLNVNMMPDMSGEAQ